MRPLASFFGYFCIGRDIFFESTNLKKNEVMILEIAWDNLCRRLVVYNCVFEAA